MSCNIEHIKINNKFNINKNFKSNDYLKEEISIVKVKKGHISIIVAVYNDENRIGYCIKSVLNQDYKNFELIIVNDGSTDSSGEISREFAKKNSRVSLVDIKNSGPSNARNVGIKKAKGEFIFFLDSDDYIEAEALNLLYSPITKSKVDLVIGDFTTLLDSKKVIPSRNILHFPKSTILSRKKINSYINLYLQRPNKYPLFAFSWGRLFRTEIIKEKKILFNKDMRTFEDVDFNFRYLCYVENAFYVKKSIINHIISTTYSSATMNIPRNYKKFFGYGIALESASNYLRKNRITKNIIPNVAHAYSAFTIIQFIRLGLQYNKRNKVKIKKIFFEFVNDPSLQKKISYYSPNKGDSVIIPILIKMKFTWLLLQFCRIKGKLRY